MHINELKTPALLVEQPVLSTNIKRMADYCRGHELNLRVDVSSHKAPMIAYKQITAGACGIACQTLSELEGFIDAGFDDILIPHDVLRLEELDRLPRLSEYLSVYVASNSQTAAEEISRVSKEVRRQTSILIEIDENGKGSDPQTSLETLKTAQRIIDLPNIDFAGLMVNLTWPTLPAHLLETLRRFEAAAIPISVVSGSGTRHAFETHEVPEMTELRSGAYVFFDLSHVYWNVCTPQYCALTVLTTVVSTPSESLAILDAGAQTLTRTHLAPDNLLPTSSPPFVGDEPRKTFGVIKDYHGAILSDLTEEYGHLNTGKGNHQFKVGEKVRVIPVDSKATISVNDTFAFIRDNRVLEILPILAAGKSTD